MRLQLLFFIDQNHLGPQNYNYNSVLMGPFLNGFEFLGFSACERNLAEVRTPRSQLSMFCAHYVLYSTKKLYITDICIHMLSVAT